MIDASLHSAYDFFHRRNGQNVSSLITGSVEATPQPLLARTGRLVVASQRLFT